MLRSAFPQLLAGLVVLATLRSGPSTTEAPVDPGAMFLAWIELVFGPPLPPEARTD